MRSIHADVHRRGGIAATYELLADGHTRRQLSASVARHEVIRVRQGHYACPELPDLEIQAYRVGGRLSGLAGGRAHGLWTPRSSRMDIQVSPDARALRTRTDATKRLATNRDAGAHVTWIDRRRPGTRSLAGPVDCITVIIHTVTPRTAFATVESALHRSVITRAEWRRVLAILPTPVARALSHAGRASESGGESLLLFDLRAAGIAATQQVQIAGLGRVDFLVGARLIIEVDGAEFHTDRAHFEEDRRRDAVASTLGFRTLRFSHAQIERGDPIVMQAILAALARGDNE